MKSWTPDEISYLKQNYFVYSDKVLADKLNRTENSIRRKLQQEGFKRPSNLWTTEQDLILIQNYSKVGASKCAEILGRSKNSIAKRASVLGLQYNNKSSYWSKEEENFLLKNYSNNIDLIKSVLNRSDVSIYQKAYKLGLKNIRPNGYSRIAIKWLNSFSNPNILHAENGGEQKILDYYVDGYDPTTNTVFEFHGDAFHGNLDVFNPSDKCNPFDNRLTAEDLWIKTFDRMLSISKVATIFYIWENDYKEGRSYEVF